MATETTPGEKDPKDETASIGGVPGSTSSTPGQSVYFTNDPAQHMPPGVLAAGDMGVVAGLGPPGLVPGYGPATTGLPGVPMLAHPQQFLVQPVAPIPLMVGVMPGMPLPVPAVVPAMVPVGYAPGLHAGVGVPGFMPCVDPATGALLPPHYLVPPAWLPDANYLPMNPAFPGLEQLHAAPPVFRVRGFLSADECDRLIHAAKDHMTPAPVVGSGNGEVSKSRTSSTCYLAREDLPSIVTRVCALTGKPLDHLELPQVGRYLPDQFYRAHYDAFDLTTPDGKRFAQNGGQRVGTVLVYLNDVAEGGHTSFSKLGLSVQPVKGDAIVFFPAKLDGTLDDKYLHAAEPAIDIKWVSQIWIRQSTYNGRASARLNVQL